MASSPGVEGQVFEHVEALQVVLGDAEPVGHHAVELDERHQLVGQRPGHRGTQLGQVRMTVAPHAGVDPFAAGTHGLDEPDRARAAMRAVGLLAAPTPRPADRWGSSPTTRWPARCWPTRASVKDPAYAPVGWDSRTAGLEPTAAQQPSVTTSDGAAHARLRRAQAPLFGAGRMQAQYPRIVTTARELLTVICDLLGVPRDRVDQAADACRTVLADYPRTSTWPWASSPSWPRPR